jgi:hypothetical protein
LESGETKPFSLEIENPIYASASAMFSVDATPAKLGGSAVPPPAGWSSRRSEARKKPQSTAITRMPNGFRGCRWQEVRQYSVVRNASPNRERSTVLRNNIREILLHPRNPRLGWDVFGQSPERPE